MGAITAFEKALEIFPNYGFGHVSLGDAYLKKGMEEKARGPFPGGGTPGTARMPTFRPTLEILSWTQVKEKRPSATIRNLWQSIPKML